MDKKAHILGLMDELLMANTTSNAQLMLLYDEIEKLFKQADEAVRLRQVVNRLNEEVVKLRGIETAAVEYLRAVSAERDDTSIRLSSLSTALGHKPTKKKTPLDPNKTMPPGFQNQ